MAAFTSRHSRTKIRNLAAESAPGKPPQIRAVGRRAEERYTVVVAGTPLRYLACSLALLPVVLFAVIKPFDFVTAMQEHLMAASPDERLMDALPPWASDSPHSFWKESYDSEDRDPLLEELSGGPPVGEGAPVVAAAVTPDIHPDAPHGVMSQAQAVTNARLLLTRAGLAPADLRLVRASYIVPAGSEAPRWRLLYRYRHSDAGEVPIKIDLDARDGQVLLFRNGDAPTHLAGS